MFRMAMVSTRFSSVHCPVAAAGFSSARYNVACYRSDQLTSPAPLLLPITTPLAIAHNLIASQCPLLSHGRSRSLLLGIASPSIWALLPFPPLAFADEQIVERLETSIGTVESSATGVAAETGNFNGVISILGTVAFVGLVVLTAGVIYLAVSDFLDKRTRDEEAKKITDSTVKKKSKGSVAATRGTAKGFGKKPQEEE